MIAAQEVRIGNWVTYEGKAYRIHAISEELPFLDTIEFGIGVVGWKDLEGIPLTEESLLDLGFEKTDDYGDQFYYALKNHGQRHYYICFDHDDISFWLSVLGSCTSLIYDAENFQFVHQLQNLFHSLTGQELVFNPKK